MFVLCAEKVITGVKLERKYPAKRDEWKFPSRACSKTWTELFSKNGLDSITKTWTRLVKHGLNW